MCAVVIAALGGCLGLSAGYIETGSNFRDVRTFNIVGLVGQLVSLLSFVSVYVDI